MEKPAQTDHPINDLMRRRWSPRAFAERPVEKEKLLSLLEAARWAPSSFNDQPWSLIIATKDDAANFEKLTSILVEGNAWAKKAPVLGITVVRHYFERNRKPNRVAEHDIGLAMENLVLQAVELGLVTHQMAGIELEKARQVFAIPEGHDPLTGIAIGYPGDPNLLDEKLKKAELEPRTRKPLKEWVFAGKWGEPASLVSS